MQEVQELIDDLKSFSFSGRMNRLKYWKYRIMILVFCYALDFIMGLICYEALIVSSLVGIVISVMSFPFEVRRLHDLDLSGWFMLIYTIPFVNIFFALYVGFFKGTDGPNKYGPDPLA